MAEVELKKEGPVAIVTLNRGAKRNAMSIAMQRELLAALGAVAGDAEFVLLVARREADGLAILAPVADPKLIDQAIRKSA